jgi:putative transposase
MKRKNWPVEKITRILQEAEVGIPVAELCRKHGMSDATYYKWKKKYGGMTVSEAKRLKEIEEENLRLKRMVVDQALDTQILKDVNSKKW